MLHSSEMNPPAIASNSKIDPQQMLHSSEMNPPAIASNSKIDPQQMLHSSEMKPPASASILVKLLPPASASNSKISSRNSCLQVKYTHQQLPGISEIGCQQLLHSV